MRAYQVIGLLVISGGLGFMAGVRFQAARQVVPAAVGAHAVEGCATCCGPVQTGPGRAAPAPQIPTASGRPCLVEFGSEECDACRRMKPVLAEAERQFRGGLDVVHIDTDVHPQQAQEWRLRMVPTQLLVSPAGQELWRHEGYASLSDLRAGLRPHLHGKPPAGRG